MASSHAFLPTPIPSSMLQIHPRGTASTEVNANLYVYPGHHLSLIPLPGCDRNRSNKTTLCLLSQLTTYHTFLTCQAFFHRQADLPGSGCPSRCLCFCFNEKSVWNKAYVTLLTPLFKVPPSVVRKVVRVELLLHLLSYFHRRCSV